jgi:hypothetical protein
VTTEDKERAVEIAEEGFVVQIVVPRAECLHRGRGLGGVGVARAGNAPARSWALSGVVKSDVGCFVVVRDEIAIAGVDGTVLPGYRGAEAFFG